MDPEASKSSEVPSTTSDGNDNNFTGVRARDPYSWEARVGKIHIGTFYTARMAAVAYDVAAEALQGDKANLNFPRFRLNWKKPKSNSVADIKEAAVNAANLYDRIADLTSPNPLDNLVGESSQGPGNHQNYGSLPPHQNQESQPASLYHPYRREQTARTSGRGSSWDQRPFLGRNQQLHPHGYRAPNPYQQNAAAQCYGQEAFQYGFDQQPYSVMPQQGLVPGGTHGIGAAAQQQDPYAHAVGPYGQAYSQPAGADGISQAGQLAPGYRQVGSSNNLPGLGYWPMMPATNIPLMYPQQGKVPGDNPHPLGQYGQAYSTGADGNSQAGQLAPGYRQVGPSNNPPGDNPHPLGQYGQAYSTGADGNSQAGQLAPGYRQVGPSNNPPGLGYRQVGPSNNLPGDNPHPLGQYGQAYSTGADGNSQAGHLAPGYRQVGPSNNPPGLGYRQVGPSNNPPGDNPHPLGQYGQAYSTGADGNSQAGQLAPGYRQVGPSNNPPGLGYWPMMPATAPRNIPLMYPQQGQVPGGNPHPLGQYGQGVYDQGTVQPAAAGSGAPVVGSRLIPGTQAGVGQEPSETLEDSDPGTVQPAAGPST